MKTRAGTSGQDSSLIIDSFSYGIKMKEVTVGAPDLYEICYILGGTGNVVTDGGELGLSVGKAIFRGNFADKKPSSAIFNNNVLTLSRGMNLLFFTAPKTAVYTVELDCTMLRYSENCNIWYFSGNDENGYRFLEIDGVDNRHDPRLNDSTVFPCYIMLDKGDSLVMGIGNFYGAVMKIDSLKATAGDGETFTFPSEHFAMYDHPHSSQTSHLEKTGDGIICAPGETVMLTAREGFAFNIFSIKLSGRAAQKTVEKNFPNLTNNIFSYGYSQALLELAPLLFLNGLPISETMTAFIFDEIMSFGEQSRSLRLNSYVENAKAIIKSSVNTPIKVTDVATRLGISDRYLYNLFIKHEGISPKQFLNNSRLEYAKKLLSESDGTVTEIAEECGFTDVLAFSHFFSEHAGISPTAFKKMKRDGGGL